MTDTATVVDAYDAVRSLLGSSFTALPCYYQKETNELPDTATAFCYVLFETHNQNLIGFGGGRGQNRWRTPGHLEVFVFVPLGEGLDVALNYAETIAALFRGKRFNGVSCISALVDPNAAKPDALHDLSGNYYAVSALIDLYFDQVG